MRLLIGCDAQSSLGQLPRVEHSRSAIRHGSDAISAWSIHTGVHEPDRAAKSVRSGQNIINSTVIMQSYRLLPLSGSVFNSSQPSRASKRDARCRRPVEVNDSLAESERLDDGEAPARR